MSKKPAPDFEDDHFRAWHGKKLKDERRKTVEVKMGDENSFMFNPAFTIFADKERTRPLFAFTPKHEEDTPFVLWLELPENVQTVEDEATLEKAKEYTLKFWDDRGYANQDMRDVLRHIAKTEYFKGLKKDD